MAHDGLGLLGYNHKLILWRLGQNPGDGFYVERAGFNSRATVKSLERIGLIRIETKQTRNGYAQYAYLTDKGEQWLQENPDQVRRC